MAGDREEGRGAGRVAVVPSPTPPMYSGYNVIRNFNITAVSDGQCVDRVNSKDRNRSSNSRVLFQYRSSAALSSTV